ncbi:MAG: phosphotransferase [Deltaproteobacteria bacterium]|nr:MAG: phosphotransferase [Deltaproteobacteria bacterium]
MMNLQGFVKTYQDDTEFGSKESKWRKLPADGSKRIFYRVSNEKGSCVVMANPPTERNAEKENLSYLKIGKHLSSKGIPVPFIYRYDLEHGWFIMEDLGQKNLQEIAINSDSRIVIYKKVVELLIEIQLRGREGFNPEWCYHTKRYDRFIMEKFESDYFLTYFLKGFLGLKEDLSGLQSSFLHLAEHASAADSNFFLYRDFQSRNLIINNDKIGVVDWQGARLGPLQYDLASLLIDPYVGLTKDEQMVLYDYYLTVLEKRLPRISPSFTEHYPYLAIQRSLQILGAFSYLSKIQGKKRFLSYVSPALRSLQRLLEELDDSEVYPLRELVRKINKNFGADPCLE